MSILSTNIDKKLLKKTEFLLAICRPTGDKWQTKTLFLAIFDPRSSIVKSFFDCRLSSVNPDYHKPGLRSVSVGRALGWGLKSC